MSPLLIQASPHENHLLKFTSHLCICTFVYLCICVFVLQLLPSGKYILILALPTSPHENHFLIHLTFVYLCICVFVYLCSCVFEYLCICIAIVAQLQIHSDLSFANITA